MQPHNGCGLKVGVTLVKEPPFKFPGSAPEMATNFISIHVWLLSITQESHLGSNTCLSVSVIIYKYLVEREIQIQIQILFFMMYLK